MAEPIADHAFKPSKRGDWCDFTYWQARGPRWLVCDYPESAHSAPAAPSQSDPSPGQSDADDAR